MEIIKRKYVIVDPFGSPYKGVTSYTKVSLKLLKELDQITPFLIVKNIDEKIECFRKRVARYVEENQREIITLEAPETLAATKFVDKNINIHIRLHFSKVIGSFLEGKPVDLKAKQLEQDEISKARFLSSPSIIGRDLSKKFFDFNHCRVFPNPIDKKDIKYNKFLFDIVFIGRWQEFKGIHFFLKLAERNRLLRFALVTDKSEPSRGGADLPRNIKVFRGDVGETVLRQSKICFVPSLFETFSSVGGEAIALGAKLVTWKQCGIGEYFDNHFIKLAEPWDIKSAEACIHTALNEGEADKAEIIRNIHNINDLYLKGIRGILNGEMQNIAQEIKPRIDVNQFLLSVERMKGYSMSFKKSSLRRKFRKLVHHPVKFFLDMIRKRTGKIAVSKQESYQKQDKSKKETLDNGGDFFQVYPNGKICFSEPSSNFSSYRTGFLFPDQKFKSGHYNELLEKIYLFDDFSPLKKDKLLIGVFPEILNDCSTLDIINNIDCINKLKLSLYKNIFVFDNQSCSLSEAIRYSNPFLNVVYVNKYNSNIIDVDKLKKFDCIIIKNDNFYKNEDIYLRKIYYYSDIYELSINIRRYVQESINKYPDLLIPVFGELKFYDEIMNFDVNRYDGLIILYKHMFGNFEYFEDYIRSLSKNIKNLYLKESVYLKYKTLCQKAEVDSAALKNLLLFSLEDGCRYHVEK